MLVDVYERIAEGMEPVAYWLLPSGWMVNTQPYGESNVHGAWFIEEGFEVLDGCIRRLDWRTVAPEGDIVPGETTRVTLNSGPVRWINGVYITGDEE